MCLNVLKEWPTTSKKLATAQIAARGVGKTYAKFVYLSKKRAVVFVTLLKRKTNMKKKLLSLLLLLTASLSAFALSYEEARDRAWFLTDKMAYELDLTQEQYDRAYQINLDYLMSISTAADCDGRYWEYRDTDFRCVLTDAQYVLFSTLDYFFRPIRWGYSAWYFPVFDRYEVGFYYFSRPVVYVSYHGIGWHHRHPRDVSPYRGWIRPVGPGLRHASGPRPPHRPGGHSRPPFRFEPADRPGRPSARPDRPGRPSQPGGRPDRPGYSDRPSRPSGSVRPSTPSRPSGQGNRQPSRPNVRPSQGASSGSRPVARPVQNASSSGQPVARPSQGASSGSRPVARPSQGGPSSGRPVVRQAGGKGNASSGQARPSTQRSSADKRGGTRSFGR